MYHTQGKKNRKTPWILREMTIDDKLIYTLNYVQQNYPLREDNYLKNIETFNLAN